MLNDYNFKIMTDKVKAVIILQEVTYEEAKSIVEDYLKTNKTAYISEIVEDLKLDLNP